MKIIIIFQLLSIYLQSHYEKFFEIEGGPRYMYYYTKFSVGSQNAPQSAIIDTGSDTLAFPCNNCRGSNCGFHQNPRFSSFHSKTFIKCPNSFFHKYNSSCKFEKSYAEGSGLNGFLASDFIRFKNGKRVSDGKLEHFNKFLEKDLKLKANFGCTTKETGLFKDQYADGILGLDDGSSFIKSLENKKITNKEKVFSFGLCFHKTGGIMSIDLRNKNYPDDKITMLKQKKNANNILQIPYTSRKNYYEIKINGFGIENYKTNIQSTTLMIDSGTTFSHFPQNIFSKIMKMLNMFCQKHPKNCGRVTGGTFNEDSCLELHQPDLNYSSPEALLSSFPQIKLFFKGTNKPYILNPKNYFYREYSPGEQNVIRLCMALKGHEEGRVILGAFSMIDYYFYFDRKDRRVKIFKEDCYLRAGRLLMKERVLEEVFVRNKVKRSYSGAVVAGFAVLGVLGVFARFFGVRRKVL